ncbi:delta-lactam-biosynthetic de-N-acetylase [Pelagirhabdus alkalitolerans]|uniref:delta-lactam-biosynthetic de-N-acetylase n=1 Tax=Pelagirhabdus alkalitolerans TaxID=1612202 RepID=UPI001FE0CADC|nr:delta-lactam-biosynthetic de-N-acetylase [Pelagirhabdus alkalitolerans]
MFLLRKIIFSLISLSCIIVAFSPSFSAYGWGYKRTNDHQVPEIGMYQDLLDQYGGYYHDDSGEKTLYLTFDNGFEAGYTDGILDILDENEVPATFFVTGHYVKSAPELIQRMVSDGHLIGNHSYTHADFTALTQSGFKEDLLLFERALQSVTNYDRTQYIRPPKGIFNAQTLEWANELGYIHMFWSLAFVDWHEDNVSGWESAYNQVMDQLHPGAIILLHTVSEDNADMLEHFIKDCIDQGYTFKSLDDLVFRDQVMDPLVD